jgi:hypothetical protein
MAEAVIVEAADAIHQYGAIASIELSHGGMECDPVFLGGRNPIGPSARSVDIGFRTEVASTVEVEEMPEALMDELAEAYAAAAATVAPIPAGPPPATRTSTSLVTGISRLGSLIVFIMNLPLSHQST